MKGVNKNDIGLYGLRDKRESSNFQLQRVEGRYFLTLAPTGVELFKNGDNYPCDDVARQ